MRDVVNFSDFSAIAFSNSYVDLLRTRVLSQPNHCIYKYLEDGESQETDITYAELDLKARQIGALLQEKKADGKRVLLLQRTMPEFIYSFLGCLYSGAVAVPVGNTRSPASLDRVRRVTQDSMAEFALTTSEIVEDFKHRRVPLSALGDLDVLATDQCPLDASQWKAPDSVGDTLAYLQYTSGSTQIPRGVMITHRNLLSTVAVMQEGGRVVFDDRVVQWVPFYHDMGLLSLLTAAIVGCTTVVIPPLHFIQRPLRWLQAITRYQATISGGPNFAYDLCVNKISPKARRELNLGSWRYAFSGGEPVRYATMTRFSKAFGSCGFDYKALYPCYGLAEYTLKISGGPVDAEPVVCKVRTTDLRDGWANPTDEHTPADEVTPIVGCGRLFKGHRALIVDPTRLESLPDGMIGEIWAQGPSKSKGYWNRPDETRETFEAYLSNGDGPFLRTGDLGFFMGDQLFVTGRRKEVIIIYGKKHYPHDIEYTVQECHPALRPNAGAVFTVGLGIDEKLVVIQEQERSSTVDRGALLKSICRIVNERHGVSIHAVVLVKRASVPRTTSGKIQRFLCRELFLNGKLPGVLVEWNRAD